MRDKIVSILKEIRPEFDFSTTDNFMEQGMLDSLDVINLVTTLESEFDVNIDGMDIVPDNFSSVDKIIELLRKSGAK